MIRPCVARGFRRSGGCAVLHQCIRPLIRARLCSGPSWISARVRSHYRTGLEGPFGSPVFAGAGKTDPPSRLILSQTSAGKRCLAYVIGSSSSRAVPLFVPCGRSFVPARACAETPRARVVKAGRRAYLALAPVLPGHALTDPSTARHSRRSGRHLVHAVAFEVALLVEDGPGDTGKLVGERDRENVVVKPLLSRFDPGLEPVAFPALWPDQHDPGSRIISPADQSWDLFFDGPRVSDDFMA